MEKVETWDLPEKSRAMESEAAAAAAATQPGVVRSGGQGGTSGTLAPARMKSNKRLKV